MQHTADDNCSNHARLRFGRRNWNLIQAVDNIKFRFELPNPKQSWVLQYGRADHSARDIRVGDQ